MFILRWLCFKKHLPAECALKFVSFINGAISNGQGPRSKARVPRRNKENLFASLLSSIESFVIYIVFI